MSFPVWTMTIPVLSTSHVSEKTANWLDDIPPDGPILIAGYGDGWFIHVPDDPVDGLPQELYPLFELMNKHGYPWVRLDSCGDTVKELPTFEW